MLGRDSRLAGMQGLLVPCLRCSIGERPSRCLILQPEPLPLKVEYCDCLASLQGFFPSLLYSGAGLAALTLSTKALCIVETAL